MILPISLIFCLRSLSYFIVLSTVLTGLTMYIFTTNSQTGQYVEQVQKNAQMQIEILLAQIQPHFLYNSLGVIRSACVDDPAKARYAIDQFSAYLRHNMDSLTNDQPIPFSEELDHVRHYLALQELRFGDALRVEYVLECTDFFLPTLTLQPIVENAVTYGVRKKKQGQGKIIIRSQERKDHWEISVTDDGPGFVPDSLPGESERSHIGIQNVRDRLRYCVGGDLIIHSVLGEGTTAAILLPKENTPC